MDATELYARERHELASAASGLWQRLLSGGVVPVPTDGHCVRAVVAPLVKPTPGKRSSGSSSSSSSSTSSSSSSSGASSSASEKMPARSVRPVSIGRRPVRHMPAHRAAPTPPPPPPPKKKEAPRRPSSPKTRREPLKAAAPAPARAPAPKKRPAPKTAHEIDETAKALADSFFM